LINNFLRNNSSPDFLAKISLAGTALKFLKKAELSNTISQEIIYQPSEEKIEKRNGAIFRVAFCFIKAMQSQCGAAVCP